MPVLHVAEGQADWVARFRGDVDNGEAEGNPTLRAPKPDH